MSKIGFVNIGESSTDIVPLLFKFLLLFYAVLVKPKTK